MIESDGSGSRVPSLENSTSSGAWPFVGDRVQHRLRRPRALHVLPLVHARVRVGGEEAVTVREQVERPVGPELQVHRVVALERRRDGADRAAVEEVVDLEDLPVLVEPDLLQVVTGELAEEDRVVVVRRELRRARVVRVVLVARRAVRAHAAGAELREELRARRVGHGLVVVVQARRAPDVVLVRVPDVRPRQRRRHRRGPCCAARRSADPVPASSHSIGAPSVRDALKSHSYIGAPGVMHTGQP